MTKHQVIDTRVFLFMPVSGLLLFLCKVVNKCEKGIGVTEHLSWSRNYFMETWKLEARVYCHLALKAHLLKA